MSNAMRLVLIMSLCMLDAVCYTRCIPNLCILVQHARQHRYAIHQTKALAIFFLFFVIIIIIIIINDYHY